MSFYSVEVDNVRFVDQKDVDNEELDVLPVRRGCGAGWCGCSGSCQVIVGHITRAEYDKHQKLVALGEMFIQLSRIKLIKQDEGCNN